MLCQVEQHFSLESHPTSDPREKFLFRSRDTIVLLDDFILSENFMVTATDLWLSWLNY